MCSLTTRSLTIECVLLLHNVFSSGVARTEDRRWAVFRALARRGAGHAHVYALRTWGGTQVGQKDKTYRKTKRMYFCMLCYQHKKKWKKGVVLSDVCALTK